MVERIMSPDGKLKPGYLLAVDELARQKDNPGIVPVGKSTIFRWVEQGMFPAPVRIGRGFCRWRTEDVQAWRDSLGDRHA